MMRITLARELDGRWIAEVPALPGVMVYGATWVDAVLRVVRLARTVLADRAAHGEP